MQVEPGNFRYRGWRESRDLVEMAKATPADLKRLTAEAQTADNTYLTTRSHLDTETMTHVSTLQHLRSQILYRVKRDS
jgi:hypothetical protein